MRREPAAAPVLVASWIAVLAISALPAIIVVLATGTVPMWVLLGQAGAVAVLLVCSLVVPTLRPLWRFAIIAGALLLFVAASAWVDFDVPALQTMLGDTLFDHRMQAEQTGKLAVALAMIGVLLLLRLRPLSKAMLETRGLFWSWWIHFLSDVVIFCFIGMALVP